MARRRSRSKNTDTPKIDPAAEEAEVVETVEGASEAEAVPDAEMSSEPDEAGASEVEAMPDGEGPDGEGEPDVTLGAEPEGDTPSEGHDSKDCPSQSDDVGGELVPAEGTGIVPVEPEADPVPHEESGETIALSPDDHAALPPPGGVDPVHETDAPEADPAVPAEDDRATVPPVASRPPPRSGGGLGSALMGGIVGAALAAAAVWLLERDDGSSAEVAALEAALAEQGQAIEALRTETESLASEMTDAGEADPRIEELLGRTAGLEEGAGRLGEVESGLGGRLDALEAAVADLSAAPVVRPGDAADASLADVGEGSALASAEGLAQVRGAVAAVRRDLTAVQDRLDEIDGTATGAADRIAALEADISDRERAITEAAARQADAAEARAALREIEAAIASGTAWEGSLTSLRETSDLEMPEVLVANAATGVAPLAELQGALTPLIREANALAPLPEGSSALVGGLARSVGLRSTAPQEGDDPAAVLTRVENAALGGDLERALEEAEALPEDVRAPLDEWIALATQRLEALRAADALAAEIGME